MDACATIVATALDQALPDSVVLDELTNELHRNPTPGGFASIVLDGVPIMVPVDVKLTMVEKALYKETYASAFPACCRADVALGDTQVTALGFLRPAYCFARLFFDLDGKCTRIEFRSSENSMIL
jgi:hypothetical protein